MKIFLRDLGLDLVMILKGILNNNTWDTWYRMVRWMVLLYTVKKIQAQCKLNNLLTSFG